MNRALRDSINFGRRLSQAARTGTDVGCCTRSARCIAAGVRGGSRSENAGSRSCSRNRKKLGPPGGSGRALGQWCTGRQPGGPLVRCVRAVASPDGCLSPIEINEVFGDEALRSGGEFAACQVDRLVRSFTLPVAYLEIFSITTTLDFPSTTNSTSSSSPLPSSAMPIGWLTCTTPSSGLLASVLSRKRRMRLSSKRTMTVSPGSTTDPVSLSAILTGAAGSAAAGAGTRIDQVQHAPLQQTASGVRVMAPRQCRLPSQFLLCPHESRRAAPRLQLPVSPRPYARCRQLARI